MFYDEAVQLCSQAVTADDASQREKAVAYYIASCDYFVAGYRCDLSITRKKLILSRVRNFIARAEMLRTSLRTRSAPTSSSSSSSTSSSSSSTGRKRAKTAATVRESTETTRFSDVVGLDSAKRSLINCVVLPQKQPQLFTGARKPFGGILLYGPPGTGKTLLAKALANEAGTNFLNVSSSDLVSKHQGESERAIRDLFDRARSLSPCVIFIDEVDSLGRIRTEGERESTRRIKTELLSQMDGVGKGCNDGVVVVGATNTPWELDPALRRR